MYFCSATATPHPYRTADSALRMSTGFGGSSEDEGIVWKRLWLRGSFMVMYSSCFCFSLAALCCNPMHQISELSTASAAALQQWIFHLQRVLSATMLMQSQVILFMNASLQRTAELRP